MMDKLTWTCHICHRERPDEKISVHKKVRMLQDRFPFVENIRYCNDNEECFSGAQNFSFIKP